MKNKIFILFLAVFLGSCPVPCSAAKKPQAKKTLRVLYWNIQNGMWAGQGDNYCKFVEWIKSKDPDICIFCEAGSIYATGTATEVPLEERYLPAHWDSLCARYGHSNVMVSTRRKSTSAKFGWSNYPQAITSKYPIELVSHIQGKKPDSVLVNNCMWARVLVDGVSQPINIVTLHLYAFTRGYGVPKERYEESAARYEGEQHRRMELEYIMDHSVRKSPDPASEYWIMAGDYNSKSRRDNFKYKYSDSNLSFSAQDYMQSEKSPYYDVVSESFPGVFMPSTSLSARIDYFYVTKPMLDACCDVFPQRDGYTARMASGVSKFFIPSDHTPIIVDFKLSKLK